MDENSKALLEKWFPKITETEDPEAWKSALIIALEISEELEQQNEDLLKELTGIKAMLRLEEFNHAKTSAKLSRIAKWMN